MAPANSIQPGGFTEEDAVFDADKALITNAATAPQDPKIARAVRIAEAFPRAHRADAERGGQV